MTEEDGRHHQVPIRKPPSVRLNSHGDDFSLSGDLFPFVWIIVDRRGSEGRRKLGGRALPTTAHRTHAYQPPLPFPTTAQVRSGFHLEKSPPSDAPETPRTRRRLTVPKRLNKSDSRPLIAHPIIPTDRSGLPPHDEVYYDL